MSAKALRWLLLPGLDGSGRLFRWFLPYLRGADVAVIEYPNAIDWSLDDYANHAAIQVGAAQRCIVIGESFSGPVALRLARNDARVVAVVLVASFVRCPNALLRLVPSWSFGIGRHLAAGHALLRTFCLGRDAAEDRIAELAAVVRSLSVSLLRSRLAILRNIDARDDLREARVPVLHLRARRDRLVSVGIADEVSTARLRETAIDGPHFLLQTRPEVCWSAIEDWLRSAFPRDRILSENGSHPNNGPEI